MRVHRSWRFLHLRGAAGRPPVLASRASCGSDAAGRSTRRVRFASWVLPPDFRRGAQARPCSDGSEACSHGHIDISNAFCQADIDGVDIWVQPPRGFEGLCQAGEGLKLLKAFICLCCARSCKTRATNVMKLLNQYCSMSVARDICPSNTHARLLFPNACMKCVTALNATVASMVFQMHLGRCQNLHVGTWYS